MCTFFYTPARRHKMYTQASPRHLRRIPPRKKCTPKAAPPPAAGKKYAYYPDTRSARRLAIPAAGLRFSRHKVHTLGRPVSRHKVHIFTTPLFPLLFYICFLFLQKVHILAGHRGSRQGKRKSAYTSRTPQRQPQPAKSAYTRQPRFVCKKYAYKAAPALRYIAKKCIY